MGLKGFLITWKCYHMTKVSARLNGDYSLSSFSSTGLRLFCLRASGRGRLIGLPALAFTAFGGGRGAIFLVLRLSALSRLPMEPKQIHALVNAEENRDVYLMMIKR